MSEAEKIFHLQVACSLLGVIVLVSWAWLVMAIRGNTTARRRIAFLTANRIPKPPAMVLRQPAPFSVAIADPTKAIEAVRQVVAHLELPLGTSSGDIDRIVRSRMEFDAAELEGQIAAILADRPDLTRGDLEIVCLYRVDGGPRQYARIRGEKNSTTTGEAP